MIVWWTVSSKCRLGTDLQDRAKWQSGPINRLRWTATEKGLHFSQVDFRDFSGFKFNCLALQKMTSKNAFKNKYSSYSTTEMMRLDYNKPANYKLLQSSSHQSRVSQAVAWPIEARKTKVSDLNKVWNCDGAVVVLCLLAKAKGHTQLSFLWNTAKGTATSIAAYNKITPCCNSNTLIVFWNFPEIKKKQKTKQTTTVRRGFLALISWLLLVKPWNQIKLCIHLVLIVGFIIAYILMAFTYSFFPYSVFRKASTHRADHKVTHCFK